MPAREASGLYRNLARARAEALAPGLAGSLNNLAFRLSELGRRQEALSAAREATGHYRQLARARPEEFMPGLAGSLNNFAARLWGWAMARTPWRRHERRPGFTGNW